MDTYATVEEKHCDPVDRVQSGGGGGLYSERADLMRAKLDAETPPPTHYNVRLLSVYSRLPEDCL